MSKVYVSLESAISVIQAYGSQYSKELAMEMLLEDKADMIIVVEGKAHKVNSGGKYDERDS